jgi:superfamily II DNA or RNA helicase
MVDECHHLSSKSMMNIVDGISGAYRFGFSGTPLKHDLLSDLKLIAVTGRVVIDISNDYLIKAGFSATPKVYLYTIEDQDKDDWELPYQRAYSELIVKNEKRNQIIVDIAKKAKGTVLILVNIIQHGKMLESMIPDSIFVNGSDEMEKRFGALDAMRTQPKGIFIASPIFDEGIDVPGLDNVILACGGKSHIKLLQRIGRGLRRKESNNILNVYDFIDDTNQYLLEHSDVRIDTYVQEGFETILA